MVWVPDGPGVTGRAALASQQKVVPRQSSTNRQSLGANRNSGPERRRGRQRPSKRGCFLVSLSLSLSLVSLFCSVNVEEEWNGGYKARSLAMCRGRIVVEEGWCLVAVNSLSVVVVVVGVSGGAVALSSARRE